MMRTSRQTARPRQSPIAQLTPRQAAILGLAADGLSQKQIARHLGISPRTVQAHFRDMRERTGARSQSELVAYAAGAGLLPPGNPQPGKPGSRPGPPQSHAPSQPASSPPRRKPSTIAPAHGDSPIAARDETQNKTRGEIYDETRDETQPVRTGARDETSAATSRCRVCATPLSPVRTGRPRRYCSRACQARAYRTRQQNGASQASTTDQTG